MRRYLKFIVLSLFAVLALWWFARDLPWADVQREVGAADWRLIAASVCVVCLTYLVRALRWRALLAPLTPARLNDLFAATTVGFGAIFAVGRAVGEVLRPAFLPLRDQRVRPAASFVTIGVERIYDTVTIVIVFALNLLWFHAPSGGDPAAYALVRKGGLLLLIGAIASVVALILFRHYSGAVIRWLEQRLVFKSPLLKRAASLVTHLAEQLAQALSVLVSARELAVTIGLTALLWSLIALANWLVLRAFHLPFGLSETLFVLGWALVGSLVPTPGGAAGAFHLATAAGLSFLGVMETKAKVVSIILHLVLFAPAFFFGLYYFFRSDVSLSRLRGMITTETGEKAELDERHGGPALKMQAQASDAPREVGAEVNA